MSISKESILISKIEEILADFLKKNNFELIDVEYVKESNNWFLRVYIDKDGGVDIEDCGSVSEYLSEQLDVHDPIPNAYFLEVSSPGVERPLRKKEDFYKAINLNIFLTTYELINHHKEFEGILTNFDGEIIQLHQGKQMINIPYSKIASARQSILF